MASPTRASSLVLRTIGRDPRKRAPATPLRTLQEWISRGEGRSQKPATPKLKAFAKDVRKAQAEARASAEVRVHERQPATWLRTEAAASEGSVEDSVDEAPNPERIRALARRVRDALLHTDPSEVVPACPNPRCRCMFHRERTPSLLPSIRRRRPRLPPSHARAR